MSMGISNLLQFSQQAEDALSQGKEALQQSLVETLSSTNLCTSAGSGNVADYMGQMSIAMSEQARNTRNFPPGWPIEVTDTTTDASDSNNTSGSSSPSMTTSLASMPSVRCG